MRYCTLINNNNNNNNNKDMRCWARRPNQAIAHARAYIFLKV